MAVGEDGTVYIAEAGVAGDSVQDVGDQILSGLSSRLAPYLATERVRSSFRACRARRLDRTILDSEAPRRFERGQSGSAGNPFAPEIGRIVRVHESSIEPGAVGLTAPYGLAMSPDGSLLVTVGAAFESEPGLGAIIRID